jgi:hypothetical protein
MKRLFTLSLLATLWAASAFGQTFDHALGLGFLSEPSILKPMPGGRWLVAGRSVPYPGALYQDSLFVAVVGHDGQVLWQYNVPAPAAEIHIWKDVLPLADDDLIVSFEATLCDVASDQLVVQRLAPSGAAVWTLQGGGWSNRPPDRWHLAPDGNLIGMSFENVWKVDVASGTVLWKADLLQANTAYAFSNVLIPDTENFLGIGNPTYQVWQKQAGPNGIVYSLANSLSLEGWRDNLTISPEGSGFYAVKNYPASSIERVDADLNLHEVVTSVNLDGLRGFAVGSEGLYLAGRQNGQNWLAKTSLDGQNPIVLPSPSTWQRSKILAVQGDSVAVAGADGSGPKSDPSNQYEYLQFQSMQAWLRTFTGDSPTPSALPNAAVTDVEQTSPIDTIGYPFPENSVYSLTGGDFRVKITNLSNSTLQSVRVNIGFERNQFLGICPSSPALQKLFANLNLAPGQSEWVHFGDVAAQGQWGLPTELCFWTSAPNAQPDAAHEDDHFCAPFLVTVHSTEPSGEAFRLAPNPAHDRVRVEGLGGERLVGQWQICDAAGRIVAEGFCPDGQSAFEVSTDNLPDGFYLFSMKNKRAKLLISH